MRVLLLNPSSDEKFVKESRCQHKAAVFQSVYPPMTLATMAALLRNSHDLKIVDAMAAGSGRKETLEQAARFNPDFVVVNTSTPTMANDLAIIDELSARIPSALFAVFGVTATYFAEDIIKRPSVSAVVLGEPEITILEMTRSADWRSVKGLVSKDEKGDVFRTPARAPFDVDSLPPPAWDLLDLSSYRMPVTGEKYVIVASGRGCPYECIFCVSPSYYGRKFRKKSVNNVIDEIRFAKSLGISSFFFFVETFTLDKQYVLDLCEGISREDLGITWFCNSRVDTVDFDVFSAMFKAGCRLVSFGIESGNQALLTEARKGTTLAQARQAVDLARKAGLATLGHFVFGLPGETGKTIKETVSFAKSLPLHFAEFHIATPFPGSVLFESMKPETFDDVDWSRFEYSSHVISSSVDLEAARSKAYRSFYLRPGVAWNMIGFYGWGSLPAVLKTGYNFIRGRFGG
jgi:radical SAM superfamily enzyme YgiQ (UPF0313 family)